MQAQSRCSGDEATISEEFFPKFVESISEIHQDLSVCNSPVLLKTPAPVSGDMN